MVMSPNYSEPPETAWAPAPEGFVPVKVERPVRVERIPGDFEAQVEESRKPFKIVQPGVLISGYERHRRFTAPLPPGLRLEFWRVTEALAANPLATVGLVAGDLHDVPKEPGLLNRGFDRVPSLFRVSGGMGGLPPEGVAALSYCNVRDLVEGPELWAVIEQLLAAGFAPEDLDTFAASPKVGSTALAACALEIVTEGQKVMRARESEELMRSLAGKLKGWSKTDTTSPFAVQLFNEAVDNAIALAKPSELPALVERLLPRRSAEAAAGGAK